MLLRKIFGVLMIYGFSVSTFAACGIDANNSINFGSYNPFDRQAKSSTGQISVTCDTSFTLSLNPGSSTDYSQRAMRMGSNVLRYNLFLNASQTIIWGDGTSSTQVINGSGCVEACQYTVYGRIAAGQTRATPGIYSDSITATLNF